MSGDWCKPLFTLAANDDETKNSEVDHVMNIMKNISENDTQQAAHGLQNQSLLGSKIYWKYIERFYWSAVRIPFDQSWLSLGVGFFLSGLFYSIYVLPF